MEIAFLYSNNLVWKHAQQPKDGHGSFVKNNKYSYLYGHIVHKRHFEK